MNTNIRQEPFTAWEALSIAAGIEQRGIHFYRAVAESAEDPAVREIFQSMIGEEHRHLALLESALHAAAGLQPEEPMVVRTYLDEIDEELNPFPEVPEAGDGASALAAAKKIEKTAATNYLMLARASVDLRAKAVLVALASDEISHKALLDERFGHGPQPLEIKTDPEIVTRVAVLEEEIRRSAPRLSSLVSLSGLEEPLPTDQHSVFDELDRMRRLLDAAENDLDTLMDNQIAAMEEQLQRLG